MTETLSSEAAALHHLTIAERNSAVHPALDGVAPRPVDVVAVIGAGTMGSGIAIAALEAGCEVRLLERDTAALERGAARIDAHFSRRVQSGKMMADAAASAAARLTTSLDWTLLAACDVVIEAVFEDLTVKREVFKRIDALARPGAVLASNTSYLDLDHIAAATQRPQDVIGLHFFSPAHVMRLLEVVRGERSTAEVLATGLAMGRRLKKLPVLAGNAFGFIGNRIYAAYRRQCEFLVEEGAAPEPVDAALQRFGFAMGPFAVADLSGLDIAWRMRQAQATTRHPDARYVHIADRLCEAGRLGRKTGAGYYRYPTGPGHAAGPLVDPAVHALIDQCRAERGITPRTVGDDEIVRRAMLAIVNEAALLLGEGVAERATDVDVVLVHGFGFPRREGGPVFWARSHEHAWLARGLDELARADPAGFVRGDLHHLLARST